MKSCRIPFAVFSVLFLVLALVSSSYAGIIVHQKFYSDILKRDYTYNIYLPDDYDNSNLRYPVLYLLHGSAGDENAWPVKGKIQPTADTLMEKGEIPPAIIVMPYHENAWWVDGNKEPAETAFIKDLIPHIDNTYRTISEKSGRLVAGLSAGGYGTVNFILKYPELFAAGAALSPAVYVPLPPESSSANRSNPYVDSEGNFQPEVWEKLNYPAFIDDYLQQDIKVPLYINTGDHDIFDIAYHAAVLYQKLREHQPKQVEYRVVDGDHEWMVWETTIGDAMKYIFSYASRPIGSEPK